MKKSIFHSILLRYMVSYAAIMAVLFVGVGLYMNNSYASTARTNTIESNINRLGVLRYQHEEKLGNLLSIGNQISISYYIQPFRLTDSPMKAYHLKLQLAPYAVTNDFSDHLFLIFHEDDYLYSSTTTVGLDMFVDKMMRYDGIPPEALRALLRQDSKRLTILPSQSVHSSLIDGTHNNMVTIFVPLSMNERYSTGNLMFLINERKYQQMFADEIYEPRNTYIFSGGEVLSASRVLDVPDEAIASALSGYEDTLILDVPIAGEEYLLIAQRSSRFDMDYATLIPHEMMQASMSRSQIGFGLFLLALSIPCMLLTIYFSRRHAKPIRQLSHLFTPDDSTRDDFAVINSGIADLARRNEALHTRLSESLPVQKASFIASFVKGHYTGREQAIARAADLSLDINRRYYVVTLIDAGGEDAQPLNVEALVAYGGENVTGYGVQLVALEHYVFVLFADTQDDLDRWTWQAKSIQLEGQLALTLAVSRCYEDFARAANAYLEASTAYDNRFVMGDAHVLRFSDVSAAAKDIVPFTRTYLDGFRKALRARDARALEGRINELFQYLNNTELSLFAFRMIYNNVIGTLLDEHLSHDGGSIDTMAYYDVFTLSSCRSIADLDDILRKLCRDILSKEDKPAVQVHPLIRDIIAYMNEHYENPELSMSAIADEYGISAVKLSLDFKEIMGMNPSEYLLLLRMEKAKELLAAEELSVKDVGAAVGYYDASGFIRRFKRYTAMTPAQYRKSVKDE